MGQLVSSQGICLNPDKLQAIHDIPPPTIVQELHSFLGLASYYRQFVKGFADIATPLLHLLKGVTWSWLFECDQAFQELKDHLTQLIIISYPEFSLPFCLYTDGSNEGLGATLSQRQDGKERMLTCANCTLSTLEKTTAPSRRSVWEWYGASSISIPICSSNTSR